jgi:hypothetical protein
MLVTQGENRLLECSALDFGQEIREFLVSGQWVAFCYVPATAPAARIECCKVGGILAKHRVVASRMER